MGHIDSLLATVVQCAHGNKEETKTSLLSSQVDGQIEVGKEESRRTRAPQKKN